MNKAILIAALLAVATSAFAKDDKKILYLGDDRYTCRGSDCGSFNAREDHYQKRREYDRQDREAARYNESREQRQRERDSYERTYRFSRYLDD